MKAVLIYVMCSGSPTFKGDFIHYNKDVQCISTVGKTFKTMSDCRKEEIQTTREVDVEDKTVKVKRVKSSTGCIEIGNKTISTKTYKMVEQK